MPIEILGGDGRPYKSDRTWDIVGDQLVPSGGGPTTSISGGASSVGRSGGGQALPPGFCDDHPCYQHGGPGRDAGGRPSGADCFERLMRDNDDCMKKVVGNTWQIAKDLGPDVFSTSGVWQISRAAVNTTGIRLDCGASDRYGQCIKNSGQDEKASEILKGIRQYMNSRD